MIFGTILTFNLWFTDQLREANQALKDANRELSELRALRIQLENERDSLAAALKVILFRFFTKNNKTMFI